MSENVIELLLLTSLSRSGGPELRQNIKIDVLQHIISVLKYINCYTVLCPVGVCFYASKDESNASIHQMVLVLQITYDCIV